MRLIDLDKVSITIYASKEVAEEVGRQLINEPIVKAIPIDWIEKWGRRNTWYYGNKDNVITTLLREWNCKQRVEQANEMLEKWDKENETTGKN